MTVHVYSFFGQTEGGEESSFFEGELGEKKGAW